MDVRRDDIPLLQGAPWLGPQRRRLLVIQGITLVRIPLAVVFLLLLTFAPGSLLRTGVCLLLWGLLELSDLADGILARRLKLESDVGRMLDPYADSASRLLVYWALARAGYIGWAVPLVMALRDVSVAYCRVVMARGNTGVAARTLGKVKAQIQAFGGLLALLGPLYWPITGRWPVTVLSWVVALGTAVSLWPYARDAWRTATRSSAPS